MRSVGWPVAATERPPRKGPMERHWSEARWEGSTVMAESLTPLTWSASAPTLMAFDIRLAAEPNGLRAQHVGLARRAPPNHQARHHPGRRPGRRAGAHCRAWLRRRVALWRVG